MVSIIIPVYNQGKSVGGTLESIYKQTYTDYEVIVVNDGSKDNSQKAFENFLSNNQINNSYVFLSQKNKGAPSARNAGYKRSKGDYLLFCDADATLTPDALEIMVNTLEKNPNASYTYSSFNWGKKFFRVGEFSAGKLKYEPYIHTMSLIRRSDFPKGGWDESIKKFQDWDLWLTMLDEDHQGVWIDKVLFNVETGGTMSSWLPSFAYKALPFLKTVREYKTARRIIKRKHRLN